MQIEKESPGAYNRHHESSCRRGAGCHPQAKQGRHEIAQGDHSAGGVRSDFVRC